MTDATRQVTVHLARLGKPARSFQEGLMEDNGIRLKTFSTLPESIGVDLSEKFVEQGFLLPGQLIASVSEYLFYEEFFSIMEFRDQGNNVLGYYCDMVTPLQRKGNEYFLTDLILDLWVFPDNRMIELDQEEFEEAVASGLIPSGDASISLTTLERLKTEIENGFFPTRYLS